ncbi:MAG TPA: hypothetical protein HPP87_13125 [Planctomycetes bacterium]|nr:hypothetical protein [Planctomycetota bacterium]
MEERKKKTILIAVIVACLALAGIITYATYPRQGGIPGHFSEQMTWVKCANPDCNQAYQITKKEYFEYIDENADPRSPATPPLICNQCGLPSVYRAFKCENENCGTVSFYGSGSKPGDFQDRCPKCGHSNTQESRNKSRQE